MRQPRRDDGTAGRGLGTDPQEVSTVSRILPSDPDPYRRAAEVAALFPEPTIDLDRLVCESCGRRGPSVGPVVLGGSCYIACARCAPAEQSCAGEAGERP